jgi:conjugative transfer signal peptidase TraF
VTGRPNWSVPRILLASLAAISSAAGLASLAGLRINMTSSMPRGLYITTKDEKAPLVEFCPEGIFSQLSSERGYRPAGICPDGHAPLVKPVIARARDRVSVSAEGISVNGRLLPNTVAKNTDSAGRSLPVWQPGTYPVSPGSLWVASSHLRNSFDSRYFGPISDRAIRHRLKPLWVFGSVAIAH